MGFFQLIPSNTKVDFVGKTKIFVPLSLLVMVGCLVAIFTRGFNFGIDFTGGTVVQVKFAEDKSSDEIRKLVTRLGYPDASVVGAADNQREYMITVPPTGDDKKVQLGAQLQQAIGPDKVTLEKVETVGPKVGTELKWSAIKALFYSVVLIMIYIWFRFDFKFAPGATVAMIHDLLIMAGFFVVTGAEFTITSVAALLTIAGYSVNDTIVIYDRARELLKAGGAGAPLGEVINRALNQTLSRTILTAVLTLISIIGLVAFTTGELKSFAVAIAIGVAVGCYSTIYIAAPVTLFVERLAAQRAGAGAR